MRNKIVLILGVLLFSSVALIAVQSYGTQKYTPQTSVSTKSSINVYAEMVNFYMGKRGAVAFVATYAGGAGIDMPINASWPELDGLWALRIAGGVGTRWWLYYHHDIYPEIPPMITLSMVYNLSKAQAISKAKSLAEKMGNILNLTFKPFWSWEEHGTTVVLFTAEGQASGNLTIVGNFMMNEIISKIPTNGLGVLAHSSVITDNVNNEIYTRASFTLIRDTIDVDNDSDTSEFIPVFLVASVIPNAFQLTTDGWWKFSVKESLNLASNVRIEPSPVSNYSAVKIINYLPLELNETYSTVPDNPLYEYSGRMIYILRGGVIDKSYDDIKIYVQPFNFTKELETMPMVTSAFFFTDIEPTIYRVGPTEWHFAWNVSLSVGIYNTGEGSAVDVTVALPIEGLFKIILDRMVNEYSGLYNPINYSEFLKGVGWNFENVTVGDREVYSFVYHIDHIDGNSTFVANFSLLLVPDALGDWGNALYFPYGPIVLYSDFEGKQYFLISNGFAASLKAQIFVAAILIPTNVTLVNATDMLFRFDFNMTVITFTGENTTVSSLNNLAADLYISRPSRMMDFTEPKLMASDFLDRLTLVKNGTTMYAFNLSFVSQLRAGVWSAIGSLNFTLNVSYMGNQIYVPLITVTNSYMLYIPPAPWIIQRWKQHQKFPYPHVELNVNKVVVYDNSTGELIIKLNVTNTGDTKTKIQLFEVLLMEYVNTSAGTHGVVGYKINNVSVLGGVYVAVDNDLGVIIVASPQITLKPGETVQVEIRIKVKANFTGTFVIRPTLIKYYFGRFAPDKIEGESSSVNEAHNEEQGQSPGQGSGGQGGRSYPSIVLASNKAIVAFQENENPMSTYSNAVLTTIQGSAAGAGGAGGTTQPRWGLILLITIIASILVAAYIIASKRKS